MPSWIKSRYCKPLFVYFFAIEITNLKLASTISFFALLADLSPCCTVPTILLNSEIETSAANPISLTSEKILSNISLFSLKNLFQFGSLKFDIFIIHLLSPSFPKYSLRKSSLLIEQSAETLKSFPSRINNFLFNSYKWSINASIVDEFKWTPFINSIICLLIFLYFNSLDLNFLSFSLSTSKRAIWLFFNFLKILAILSKSLKTFGLSFSSIAASDTFKLSNSLSSSFSSFSSFSLELLSNSFFCFFSFLFSFSFSWILSFSPDSIMLMALSILLFPKSDMSYVASKSTISLSNIVPSLIASFQLIIDLIVRGLSQIAPIIISLPASILFAIAISPSLLNSSTPPISFK